MSDTQQVSEFLKKHIAALERDFLYPEIVHDPNCPTCQGSGIAWFMTSSSEADHDVCECGRVVKDD